MSRDRRDISWDRWDVSPGQTGCTPGGVPPKFFMFIGFFLSQFGEGNLVGNLVGILRIFADFCGPTKKKLSKNSGGKSRSIFPRERKFVPRRKEKNFCANFVLQTCHPVFFQGEIIYAPPPPSTHFSGHKAFFRGGGWGCIF